MNKIYIVMGTTGEYSDRTEWPVKAFFNKQKAERLVRLASERAREIFSSLHSDWYNVRKALSQGDIKNEYDSNFQIDYTGTLYFLSETELE